MLHRMNLRTAPFEAIRSGRKTFELRLFDEKRRLISPGDRIDFSCEGERVLTEVLALHPFASFAELYASLPLLKCGYTEENISSADPRDMEAYYPPEKQAEHGVLAIELKLI